MAIRNIWYYDDPILHKWCKAVKKISTETGQILDDMLDTFQQTENSAAIATYLSGNFKAFCSNSLIRIAMLFKEHDAHYYH